MNVFQHEIIIIIYLMKLHVSIIHNLTDMISQWRHDKQSIDKHFLLLKFS